MELVYKILHIDDPETNMSYELSVSEEDYIRAHKDIQFATVLLQHAIESETEATKENNPATHQSEPCTSTFKVLNVNRSQDTSTTNEADKAELSLDSAASSKHIWKYSETVALIKSKTNHHEDSSHAKKRKRVFENISNDLLSEGISCNGNLCQVKWKSLVRSYSQAKDNQSKTGRGPSRFQFFYQMDGILGTKPTSKCVHTLDNCNIGESISKIDMNSANTNSTNNAEKGINDNNLNKEPLEVVHPAGKKRKRNKEEYIKEYEHNKNKRHQERMEIETMKIEIEKQKIDVLKQYLKGKKMNEGSV